MPSRQAFSDLDVINMACNAMGENEIDNIQTDQSTAAQTMRRQYVAVKQYCLGMSSWRFATTKAALNLLSDTPPNRWAAAWQLPADLLKVLFTWPASRYEIQGQRLYTNARRGVELDYIRNIEEAYWLDWFTRLVVAELVMRTCKPITGDEPSQAMKDERRAARQEAYFQDAQQQPNQTDLPSDFIDARF
jgi:hypothetical protein